jgi:TBC1 domain family member 5
MRLLFGREFPFDDALRIWDILFAEDPSLDLVDLICVAMLLRVRWERTNHAMNTQDSY